MVSMAVIASCRGCIAVYCARKLTTCTTVVFSDNGTFKSRRFYEPAWSPHNGCGVTHNLIPFCRNRDFSVDVTMTQIDEHSHHRTRAHWLTWKQGHFQFARGRWAEHAVDLY
jgi:hypothetical protein